MGAVILLVNSLVNIVLCMYVLLRLQVLCMYRRTRGIMYSNNNYYNNDSWQHYWIGLHAKSYGGTILSND